MARTSKILLTAVAMVVAAALATLAMPVRLWRTGDQGLDPLRFTGTATTLQSPRVWIDTDAACGHGARTDPDDCLAIALLARSPNVEIVGISTVFGNASREVVDKTVQALTGVLFQDTGHAIPVWHGAAAPDTIDAAVHSESAVHALIAALDVEPLSIVALGPLTNVAAVLQRRPDLAARVSSLVAVMGRRPGHIFHPAEGEPAGSFLGHGPVFRDLNFALDQQAAKSIVAQAIPLTLVPYDAARGIEITRSDVSALAGSGAAGRWIAPRLRPWLSYWRQSIGREGFFPFDLIAAAILVQPDTIRCADVQLWVGEDEHVLLPGLRQAALLVADRADQASRARPTRPGQYCAAPAPGFKRSLLARLLASPRAATATPATPRHVGERPISSPKRP